MSMTTLNPMALNAKKLWPKDTHNCTFLLVRTALCSLLPQLSFLFLIVSVQTVPQPVQDHL